MEVTAVSVGKAVLNGALGYAKSKAAEEIALQLGVEHDVTFIADELQMMQSFLMMSDEEQGQHMVLITWVQQVRDLAYKVEDSLMDFDLHAEKKPIWWCIPRDLCDRRRIAMEVKDLRAKVEDVSSRNLRYRLIKEGSSGSKPAATVAAEEQASLASAEMFGINEARLATVEEGKPTQGGSPSACHQQCFFFRAKFLETDRFPDISVTPEKIRYRPKYLNFLNLNDRVVK